MTWKLEQADRQPLSELDHVVRIPIAIDLARLMVPNMRLAAGSLGEVVWVGEIADHADEDLRYPANPVDVIQDEGQLYAVTTRSFGHGALMEWIKQTLLQPMISLRMRSCA